MLDKLIKQAGNSALPHLYAIFQAVVIPKLFSYTLALPSLYYDFFKGFSIDSQFCLSPWCANPPASPGGLGVPYGEGEVLEPPTPRGSAPGPFLPCHTPSGHPAAGLPPGRTSDTAPASGRQPGRKEAVRFLILLVNFTLR